MQHPSVSSRNFAPIRTHRNQQKEVRHQPRSRSGPRHRIGHRLIRRMADGIAVGIGVARNAEPNRSCIGRRNGTSAVNVMALKWRMIGLGVAGRVSADLRRIDPYDALLRPVLPRWQAGLADPSSRPQLETWGSTNEIARFSIDPAWLHRTVSICTQLHRKTKRRVVFLPSK